MKNVLRGAFHNCVCTVHYAVVKLSSSTRRRRRRRRAFATQQFTL